MSGDVDFSSRHLEADAEFNDSCNSCKSLIAAPLEPPKTYIE
jgi:hypothetical protein